MNRSASGVMNFVGPDPATARDVVRALARRVHRLYWFPAPGFMLRLFLGDAAKEMLLSSQKVVPTHLIASGFIFDDDTIDHAIVRALRDADRRAI
jgi:NAD dependent epimerase/dehydratase family enzyme